MIPLDRVRTQPKEQIGGGGSIMNTGQHRLSEAARADLSREPGLGLREGEQAEVATPRMTPADAVYMTATVTAVVLLLITVF